MRPAEGIKRPVLDINTAGNIRPPLKPNTGRLDGLPNVNERVTQDENRTRPAS